MIIPHTTKNDRYYVAISLNKAYSSWATLEEARDCVVKFNQYDHVKESANKIVCIVRTNLKGKEILRSE